MRDNYLKGLIVHTARRRMLECIREMRVIWDTYPFCPIAYNCVHDEARKQLAELGGMAGEW